MVVVQFVNFSRQIDEMQREYEQRTTALNGHVTAQARHFGDGPLGTHLIAPTALHRDERRERERGSSHSYVLAQARTMTASRPRSPS
jgi:hypothetical protein